MFDISKIVITPEMLKLVAEIDEFKGCLLYTSRCV